MPFWPGLCLYLRLTRESHVTLLANTLLDNPRHQLRELKAHVRHQLRQLKVHVRHQLREHVSSKLGITQLLQSSDIP